MKKLIVILSAIILSAPAMAQDVPQNVVTSFNTKYPGIEAKKWKTTTDGYTAEFTNQKKKSVAYFSTNGDWVRTEKKVSWPWNLPPQVKKSFDTGKFAAWYVEKIKDVETSAGHSYVLRVNNKALLPAHEINVFRETRLLYYNEKGELISSNKI